MIAEKSRISHGIKMSKLAKNISNLENARNRRERSRKIAINTRDYIVNGAEL